MKLTSRPARSSDSPRSRSSTSPGPSQLRPRARRFPRPHGITVCCWSVISGFRLFRRKPLPAIEHSANCYGWGWCGSFSPASMGKGSRFCGGGTGQMGKLSVNAHGRFTARLKSSNTVPFSPGLSTVSDRHAG